MLCCRSSNSWRAWLSTMDAGTGAATSLSLTDRPNGSIPRHDIFVLLKDFCQNDGELYSSIANKADNDKPHVEGFDDEPWPCQWKHQDGYSHILDKRAGLHHRLVHQTSLLEFLRWYH